MNFFERQAQTRAHSRRLVVLFALCVVTIVAAVDAAVLAGVLVAGQHAADGLGARELVAANSGLLLATTAATIALIVGASLFKIARLRSGGAKVAESLGATPLPTGNADPKYRRLRNVVEEIAIASGVPVPAIYVLEGEAGINAFAAGFSPADAAITVTRGSLDKLSRDELQGVIAHEFSHIVNGDMRLSIRLMGVVFGILLLAVVARGVLRTVGRGRRSGKGGGGIAAVLVAAVLILLIGYIGVFFARLIKASFSRQRETLADASAVQFTRQTQGLAGALKKIAGITAGSHLASARTEEVSHMLFGEGLALSRLFATHPPVLERIKALEPRFELRQIDAQAVRWNDPAYTPEDAPAPVAGLVSGTAAAPAQAASAIASPGAGHYRYGAIVRASLPQPLKDVARDPARAHALVLALLVDPDAGVRARQLARVQARFGPDHKDVDALHLAVAKLDPALHLPLVELAFPAVRRRPREQLLHLVNAIGELARADGNVSLFEYCLGRVLRTHVADALNPARAKVVGHLRLPQGAAEVALLLSAVAQAGTDSADAARRAYAAGSAQLRGITMPAYQPQADWPARLDPALQKLDGLTGPAKELLVEALLKTVTHDGRVAVSEAELLRAICAALHVPLPPLVETEPGTPAP